MNQVISILFLIACIFGSVSSFPASSSEGGHQRFPRQVTYNWVASDPFSDYAGVTYYPDHSGIGFTYSQPYPRGYYGNYDGQGQGYHYSLVSNNDGYHHQAHYQHA